MEEPSLNDQQQLQVLERLNDTTKHPPSIKELLDIVYPNNELDARSKEGIMIRAFIADKGLEYKPARKWIPEKNIVITEDQKVFISNNIQNTKPLEMARILFNNPNLTNLDSETKAIYKYISGLPKNIANTATKEAINIEDYKPPKTEDQAIARVNNFVSNARLDRNKLTEKQKRDINNLIGYLHTIRYLHQIKTYGLVDDRQLFESEFIRCVYDKTLTEEEVDQYIIYATEVVSGKQIAKRIEMFERQQDQIMEDGNKQPTMTLVEAVNTLRQDLNQCIIRQRALLKALQGERKERLNANRTENTSILDLLSYWKDYQRRQHLAKLALVREKELRDEIERLKTLDEIKLEIFGITESELLGE